MHVQVSSISQVRTSLRCLVLSRGQVRPSPKNLSQDSIHTCAGASPRLCPLLSLSGHFFWPDDDSLNTCPAATFVYSWLWANVVSCSPDIIVGDSVSHMKLPHVRLRAQVRLPDRFPNSHVEKNTLFSRKLLLFECQRGKIHNFSWPFMNVSHLIAKGMNWKKLRYQQLWRKICLSLKHIAADIRLAF